MFSSERVADQSKGFSCPWAGGIQLIFRALCSVPISTPGLSPLSSDLHVHVYCEELNWSLGFVSGFLACDSERSQLSNLGWTGTLCATGFVVSHAVSVAEYRQDSVVLLC